MLKKSFFSPAQPRRAETRLFTKVRSRVAQRFNVRPRKTTVPTGDGRAGEKDLRFAPSLAAAAFLIILSYCSLLSEKTVVTATGS